MISVVPFFIGLVVFLFMNVFDDRPLIVISRTLISCIERICNILIGLWLWCWMRRYWSRKESSRMRHPVVLVVRIVLIVRVHLGKSLILMDELLLMWLMIAVSLVDRSLLWVGQCISKHRIELDLRSLLVEINIKRV